MKSFLINSLLAAGMGQQEVGIKPNSFEQPVPLDNPMAWDLLQNSLPFTLAGHSSHRSHGSHRSHRSHRSSSSYRGAPQTDNNTQSGEDQSVINKPNRNIDSTPNTSVLPHSPAVNIPKVNGNSALFTEIVKKVQMHLFGLGFYSGAVDGLPGDETHTAVMKYQKSKGFKITGVIDDQLVKAMNIEINE